MTASQLTLSRRCRRTLASAIAISLSLSGCAHGERTSGDVPTCLAAARQVVESALTEAFTWDPTVEIDRRRGIHRALNTAGDYSDEGWPAYTMADVESVTTDTQWARWRSAGEVVQAQVLAQQVALSGHWEPSRGCPGEWSTASARVTQTAVRSESRRKAQMLEVKVSLASRGGRPAVGPIRPSIIQDAEGGVAR